MHINKINNKKYVGQTIHGEDPNKRWQNGCGYRTQQLFYRAIQKYGWDNFKHEVVAFNLTEEKADEIEMLYIQKFNTANPQFGYNVSLGGGGTPGRHPTEAQINKYRSTMRKYLDDPEYRKKMKEVVPKRAVCQFTVTGEFIATYESLKEAERQTGIHNGDISKCALGTTANKGDYIFVFCEDIDTIAQRVERYNNTKKLRKEPIIQLTLDGEFVGQWLGSADAGRGTGISYKNINAVCRGKRPQAGGFKWMYLSDYSEMNVA